MTCKSRHLQAFSGAFLLTGKRNNIKRRNKDEKVTGIHIITRYVGYIPYSLRR